MCFPHVVFCERPPLGIKNNFFFPDLCVVFFLAWPSLLISPPLSRQILIRLRQAVDHPYLVIYSSTKREGMTPALPPQPSATARPTAATPPSRSSNGHATPTRPSRGATGEASTNGGARGGGEDASAKSAGDAVNGVHIAGETSSDESDSSEGVTTKASEEGVGGAAGQGVMEEDDDGDDYDGDVCGICSEPAERPVSSACGHSFCRTW